MRGVFRSTDGGKTWNKTLYVDDDTGAQKIAWAFDNPKVIFATTVAPLHRPPPPGRGGGPGGGAAAAGPRSTKLFKSTDGADLDRDHRPRTSPRADGKTSIAVANEHERQRMFLIGNFGFYRSDDGGANWHQMAANDSASATDRTATTAASTSIHRTPTSSTRSTRRATSRATAARPSPASRARPAATIRSRCGSIPPTASACSSAWTRARSISLDGGLTWSSWYNQSTEQVYHISTDNSFPYWIYATQQDAGAIRRGAAATSARSPRWTGSRCRARSRARSSRIRSIRRSSTRAARGYLKIAYPSEQWINMSPTQDTVSQLRTTATSRSCSRRGTSTSCIAGFQSLMDDDRRRRALDKDQPRPRRAPRRTAPPTGAGATAPPGGAIRIDLARRRVAPGMIWVGTNNGLIKVTKNDGKTWTDVSIPDSRTRARAEVSRSTRRTSTPPKRTSRSISIASATTRRTSIRTHDYGKTWTQHRRTAWRPNQPSGSFARVIRDDTKKRGCCSPAPRAPCTSRSTTATTGSRCSSTCRTRRIATSRSRTTISSSSTYGRGFWVLDDYSMLRQITPAIASEAAHSSSRATCVACAATWAPTRRSRPRCRTR